MLKKYLLVDDEGSKGGGADGRDKRQRQMAMAREVGQQQNGEREVDVLPGGSNYVIGDH